MTRLLLLMVVAGIFLAMFCVTPQQPLSAETGGMEPVAPKPLQMEAPPVVCGPTPSHYQVAELMLNGNAHAGVTTDAQNPRFPRPTKPALRDSAQASTVLRIEQLHVSLFHSISSTVHLKRCEKRVL